MRTDQTSTGTRVDHFGRSTPPTPTCGSSWADRGENSEPGETHPRKRRLTPAIRELIGADQSRSGGQMRRREFIIATVAGPAALPLLVAQAQQHRAKVPRVG